MLCFSVFFFLCFLAHFRPTSGGIVGMPGGDMAYNERAGLPPNPPKKIKKAKRGLT